MNSPKIWLGAVRLKTLVASVAAVLVGASLSFERYEPIQLQPLLGCLFFAIFLQIGTNFANDYYDFLRGADRDRKLGPKRFVAAGIISPQSMFFAYLAAFLLAFLTGVFTLWSAGVSFWFFPFGLLCICCGYLYTGGPFPFAYNGLGDLFVILFFGFGAVEGTHLLMAQAHHLDWAPSYSTSLAIGLLINNLLVVNNYRDFETDLLNRKRTLITLLGKRSGPLLYLVCFFVPTILRPWFEEGTPVYWECLLLGVFVFIKLQRAHRRGDFNLCLSLTAILVVIYSFRVILSNVI